MNKLPKLHSLQVRLCLLYCCITMAGLLSIGAVSYLYLRSTLESARSATLQRRVERLVRFLDTPSDDGAAAQGQADLAPVQLARDIRRFSIASPESEHLQVSDADSNWSYNPVSGMAFAWPSSECVVPCMRRVVVDGRRMRLLQQTVTVRRQRLRVTIVGLIDEHDSTLRTVLGTYIFILPLALVGSLAGGMLLGGRAFAPVDRMTRVAARIGIRNLGERLPVPQTGDEVQRLAETWNELLCRLEAAVTQLQQFTSDISHDLRTAMTVMLANVEVALQRPRSSEEYQRTLHIIATECRATAHLLEDLLLSERSAQDTSLTQQIVPFSEIVEESCDQFSGRVLEKSQRLSLDIMQDGWVKGDASLLRRLVGILLDNAVKHTPDHRQISVALHSDGHHAELIVSDNGDGMSPEVLARVFDRSFRADPSRSRDSGGNGLGLAIAKRIVEAHEGQISASSEVGLGSSFRVHLRCDLTRSNES